MEAQTNWAEGVWALRALGLVAMGGHIGVASATELPITGGTRWDTLAPHTTCPTCPLAQVGPRMHTAPRPAQPSAICTHNNTKNSFLYFIFSSNNACA